MSKEKVEQAERIRDQYTAERKEKEQQLADHENFKNGQPRTPDDIDKWIDRKEELEQNRDAVLFTLVSTLAMFLILITIIIVLLRYRKNRREEEKR